MQKKKKKRQQKTNSNGMNQFSGKWVCFFTSKQHFYQSTSSTAGVLAYMLCLSWPSTMAWYCTTLVCTAVDTVAACHRFVTTENLSRVRADSSP